MLLCLNTNFVRVVGGEIMDNIRKQVERDILIDQLSHLYNTLDSIERLTGSIQTGNNADEFKKSLNLVERIIKEKKQKLAELNDE